MSSADAELGNDVEKLGELPKQNDGPVPEPIILPADEVYPSDRKIVEPEAPDNLSEVEDEGPHLHTMDSPFHGEPGSREWNDDVQNEIAKRKAAAIAAGTVAAGGLAFLWRWLKGKK